MSASGRGVTMELEMRVRTVLSAAVCAITVLAAEKLEDTFGLPLDHKAIQYNETAPNDQAARLFREVEQGKVKLTWQRNGWGYLVSLLDKLGIDKNSQVLVFSQTSIQIEHISPR